MNSIFNDSLCARALLQPIFYASICFVCSSLCTVPATWVLCVYTKGLVPASYPCNMSPDVCQPVGSNLYLEEKNNYHDLLIHFHSTRPFFGFVLLIDQCPSAKEI